MAAGAAASRGTLLELRVRCLSLPHVETFPYVTLSEWRRDSWTVIGRTESAPRATRRRGKSCVPVSFPFFFLFRFSAMLSVDSTSIPVFFIYCYLR
jgi:hypothetical protein